VSRVLGAGRILAPTRRLCPVRMLGTRGRLLRAAGVRLRTALRGLARLSGLLLPMLDPLLPARVLAALRVSRLLARLLPARLRPALSRLLGRVLSVLLVRGRRLGPTGLRAVLRLPALLLGGTAVRTEAAVHRALRLSGLFGAGAIVLRRAPRLRRRLRPGPRRGLGPGLRIRAGFARCDGRAHTCRAAAAPGGTVRSATRGRGRGVRESARNLGRRGVAALPVRERAVVLIPVPSAV